MIIADQLYTGSKELASESSASRDGGGLPMEPVATRLSGTFISFSMMLLLGTLSPYCAAAQSGSSLRHEPDQTWAGRRIVTLEGFGDYFVSGDHGQSEVIRPDGLGVNIVAVAQRVEGDRIWIKANGAGDVPVGWVNKKDAILLEDANPYFTSIIERNPKDWDAYLRRAESEHALNQREAAIADY